MKNKIAVPVNQSDFVQNNRGTIIRITHLVSYIDLVLFYLYICYFMCKLVIDLLRLPFHRTKPSGLYFLVLLHIFIFFSFIFLTSFFLLKKKFHSFSRIKKKCRSVGFYPSKNLHARKKLRTCLSEFLGASSQLLHLRMIFSYF